jgi:hypothetical protein
MASLRPRGHEFASIQESCGRIQHQCHPQSLKSACETGQLNTSTAFPKRDSHVGRDEKTTLFVSSGSNDRFASLRDATAGGETEGVPPGERRSARVASLFRRPIFEAERPGASPETLRALLAPSEEHRHRKSTCSSTSKPFDVFNPGSNHHGCDDPSHEAFPDPMLVPTLFTHLWPCSDPRPTLTLVPELCSKSVPRESGGHTRRLGQKEVRIERTCLLKVPNTPDWRQQTREQDPAVCRGV